MSSLTDLTYPHLECQLYVLSLEGRVKLKHLWEEKQILF